MNKFEKIWNDPVWSKVIATGIVLIIPQIFILISSIINNISMRQAYVGLLNVLIANCLIPLWIMILCVILIVFLIVVVLRRFWENIIESISKLLHQKKTEKHKSDNDVAEIGIHEASTVFFHYRFCDAFPGFDNGYRYFTKHKDINTRLSILLKHPTRFRNFVGHGITGDPIWWFRGYSAMPIERIKILTRDKILLNHRELKIEMIAAYRGHLYYEDFIYVQCNPDTSIGIYNYSSQDIKNCFDNNGVYTEDFGLFNGKVLTRLEYDDGSAVIKGKPRSTIGAELRTRILTKSSFIIAAKHSPYNCQEFEQKSDLYLSGLIKGEIGFDDFVSWMKKFEKNRNDY